MMRKLLIKNEKAMYVTEVNCKAKFTIKAK